MWMIVKNCFSEKKRRLKISQNQFIVDTKIEGDNDHLRLKPIKLADLAMQFFFFFVF